MIHPLVRNIAFTALAASALALGACSDSGAGLPGYGDITMRLTVDPGLAASGSRATAPDYFEDPSGVFEQVSTLRVIILRGVPENQNAVGTVEANKLVHTNTEGYPYDNLEFKVKDNEYKRVYLIANEASLKSPVDGKTTREFLDQFQPGGSLDTKTFADWTAAAPGNNESISGNIFAGNPGQVGLPLTEWFDVPVLRDSPGRTDAPGAKDNVSISVHLFLTRAAAKATFAVEVDDDYPVSGTTITAIRLCRLNLVEYVFPRAATYQPEKTVEPEMSADGVRKRYITDFTSIGTSFPSYTISGLSIPVVAGSEKTLPAIYFPESKRPDDLPYTVEVLLDGDKGNTTWLTAQPLGAGAGNNILVTPDNHQAIARNTHLKITIGFGSTGVNFTTEVLPYIGVDLNPGFGFDQLKPKH